jgi:hypothetical protein
MKMSLEQGYLLKMFVELFREKNCGFSWLADRTCDVVASPRQCSGSDPDRRDPKGEL